MRSRQREWRLSSRPFTIGDLCINAIRQRRYAHLNVLYIRQWLYREGCLDAWIARVTVDQFAKWTLAVRAGMTCHGGDELTRAGGTR